MQITWLGQSCFQIASSQGKNGQVAIVTDPFDERLGLKALQLEAEIVMVSHNHYDHNNAKAIKGNPFLINGPGEYDIQGAYIQGIPAFHDDSQGKERGETTIFTIEMEEMRICHLGDLGQKELTEDQLEKIGTIDILMIPIGGVYTIDAKGAAKIISQIEPKIIIPMHYQIPKLKMKLEGLDKFLKTMGQKAQEPQNKIIIKKKDLPEEETRIVILKA